MPLQETTDYFQNFDPEWYLNKYYSNADGSKVEGKIAKCHADSFQKMFRKGKCS